MKYIETFEYFYYPSDKELEKYDIKIGDYVIVNDDDYYYSFGIFYIDDIVHNDIGKVEDIFISNKGFSNEELYCDVHYENISAEHANHLSDKSGKFDKSIPLRFLRKITKDEYDDYMLKKETEKYNL